MSSTSELKEVDRLWLEFDIWFGRVKVVWYESFLNYRIELVGRLISQVPYYF